MTFVTFAIVGCFLVLLGWSLFRVMYPPRLQLAHWKCVVLYTDDEIIRVRAEDLCHRDHPLEVIDIQRDKVDFHGSEPEPGSLGIWIVGGSDGLIITHRISRYETINTSRWTEEELEAAKDRAEERWDELF